MYRDMGTGDQITYHRRPDRYVLTGHGYCQYHMGYHMSCNMQWMVLQNSGGWRIRTYGFRFSEVLRRGGSLPMALLTCKSCVHATFLKKSHVPSCQAHQVRESTARKGIL